MAETKRSPEQAPAYALHRHKPSGEGVDSGDATEKKHGMNMSGNRFANIQVVPLAASGNPDVEILFWSEAASKFIRGHTQISKAGVGAGVAYEFEVDVQGRIIYAYITGTVTGGIEVYVGGYSARLTG